MSFSSFPVHSQFLPNSLPVHLDSWTRTDLDGPGWARTDPDGPRWTCTLTDPFLQILERFSVNSGKYTKDFFCWMAWALDKAPRINFSIKLLQYWQLIMIVKAEIQGKWSLCVHLIKKAKNQVIFHCLVVSPLGRMTNQPWLSSHNGATYQSHHSISIIEWWISPRNHQTQLRKKEQYPPRRVASKCSIAQHANLEQNR